MSAQGLGGGGMSKRTAVTVVSGALLTVSFAAAQPPPASQAPEPTPRFVSGAEVVALDLVVRDKKGKLVTDLREGEIEVLEDGVPQKLTSFRAIPPAAPGAGVPGSDAAAAAAPALAPAVAAASTPRRVVLVFGRLSSDGRRLAQSAGDEFARKHMTPQTAVTVVRIDGGLIPVLDRASDPVAVKEAVREATAAIGGGPARAGGPVGADTTYSGQQLSRFQGGAGANDLSQADSVALVNALITVVDGLKADAGRKTVLFFSEGFAVPPGYEHVFADLQSRANRANVSFYGIDVRGLQLSTQLGSSGAALATTAAISAQQRQADGGAGHPGAGDAGRHDADEPAVRRGRRPRPPLDQHGRLPRDADERLRPAPRPHRRGHPRLLRGLLRALVADGAGRVPQDRGARRPQGRARAVALRLLHDAAHGRRGVRGVRRGAAPGRLRGAEPLLPLRPRGRRAVRLPDQGRGLAREGGVPAGPGEGPAGGQDGAGGQGARRAPATSSTPSARTSRSAAPPSRSRPRAPRRSPWPGG